MLGPEGFPTSKYTLLPCVGAKVVCTSGPVGDDPGLGVGDMLGVVGDFPTLRNGPVAVGSGIVGMDEVIDGPVPGERNALFLGTPVDTEVSLLPTLKNPPGT